LTLGIKEKIRAGAGDLVEWSSSRNSVVDAESNLVDYRDSDREEGA
jgi:hypothetical protein